MKSNVFFHIAPARSVVNDIQDDCGYIIVSSEHEYEFLYGRSNVLVLHFADTEVASRFDAISTDDADRIIEFAAACPYEDIFVSCDAGESRSPAIAAALIRISGNDDSYIWNSREYWPNQLVYQTILNRAGL